MNFMNVILIVWEDKMSLEIKEKIEKLNEELESKMRFDTFTLNPDVVKIQKEIVKLQKQCKHEFNQTERVCIYCGVMR